MSAAWGRGETGRRRPRARRLHRRLGSRRAVLEGMPLSMLISILIIAIGTIVIVSLYAYAQVTNLSSVTVYTTVGQASGFLPATPTQLRVTAWTQNGGTMGGVTIVLNGSGISERGQTSGNGSAYFWIEPVLHNHATSGVLNIFATYTPTVSLVAPAHQSYQVTLSVLS